MKIDKKRNRSWLWYYLAGLIALLFVVMLDLEVLVWPLVIGMFVVGAVGLFLELRPDPNRFNPKLDTHGYRVNYRQHYLTIKNTCFPTLFLELSGAKVHIYVDLNNSLVMYDEHEEGKRLILDGKTKEANLRFGSFYVTKQKNGYRVSWSRYENWRLWGM